MAATTFKSFDSSDVINTKTLLHEAIPLTGTIVSGTYSDNNIKNFSHGMFQSVYDYPYLSSSANHVFDIAVGYAATSTLSGSSATQNSKKINIYNQMAQALMGYDVTGNVLLFDEDGDILAGGNKIREAYFINFSRLLTKDEVKKGTFELKLGVGGTGSLAFNNSENFANLIKVADTNAQNDYRVNASAGEYGILYATEDTGTPLTDSTPKCGLIFYQAGVVVLSSSVFQRTNQGGLLDNTQVANVAASITMKAVSSTLTDYGNDGSMRFTLVSADGTSVEYAIYRRGPQSTGGTGYGYTHIQLATYSTISAYTAQIKEAIEHANGHNGKLTVTISTVTATNDTLTITQATTGTDGNTTVAAITGGDADGLTINGGITATAFSGGSDGIVVNASGSYISADSLVSGSISGSADGLRARIHNISFNNTTELNSSIHFCRINHNEFNYSSNPTYLNASKIRVKRQAADNPVSYITTIGLYSADQELLAVGKLSEPLKNDPTQDMTLRVRLDY